MCTIRSTHDGKTFQVDHSEVLAFKKLVSRELEDASAAPREGILERIGRGPGVGKDGGGRGDGRKLSRLGLEEPGLDRHREGFALLGNVTSQLMFSKDRSGNRSGTWESLRLPLW